MKLQVLRLLTVIYFGAVLSAIPLSTAYAKPMSDDSGAAGGVTIFLCCGALVVLNIALLAWVAKDASSRGTSAGAWLLIVFLFGLLGLLAYLVARPQGRLEACPNCSRQRPITALVCPHCGYRGGGIPGAGTPSAGTPAS